MKCPVDNAPLREVERGGFKLTCCSQCTGLWLTRDTLKQAFASHHSPEVLDEAKCQPRAQPTIGPRQCPGCNGVLAARWLHGIEMDVCEHCRGLWLDAGELQQIVANSRQRGAGAPPPGGQALAGSRESRWYDGLDVPCDADFLTAIGSGLGDLASSGAEVAKPIVEFLADALSLLDW